LRAPDIVSESTGPAHEKTGRDNVAVDFRQPRHWLFAAGATSVAALLIACGGSGGGSPTTPSDSGPAPSTQAAPALPDGQQLVFLRSLDTNSNTAVVDPVEMLTGDAAHSACMAQQPTEPELCELDYYVSNTAVENITIPVSANANYVAATSDNQVGGQAPGATGWQQSGTEWICEADVEQGCPASAAYFASLLLVDSMLLNITVEGGEVTVLVHQYTA
jgi:hypothetical protein